MIHPQSPVLIQMIALEIQTDVDSQKYVLVLYHLVVLYIVGRMINYSGACANKTLCSCVARLHLCFTVYYLIIVIVGVVKKN